MTMTSVQAIRWSSVAFAVACLSGCAKPPNKPLYEWGAYQGQVYEHFKGDGKGPADQINVLDAQLQAAKAKGTNVPPGFHAHLGLLKLKAGNQAEAVAHMQNEKGLFPESTTLIDWVLSRLQGKKP